VAVYPVPAYSTLGWSNWLGGDPLLNTFVQGGEIELARLLFHELAHQLIYVKDDTAFNESFATAVERLGLARWLAGSADQRLRQAYSEAERRRQAFRTLKRETRERLVAVYAQPELSDPERLVRKAQVLADLRGAYRQLRAGWGLDPARVFPADRWVEEANNASLAAEGAYDQWVPAFEELFAREVGSGADWRPFYAAVRRLADLPAPARGSEVLALIAEQGRGQTSRAVRIS
jgi:predicted aminopeptidase